MGCTRVARVQPVVQVQKGTRKNGMLVVKRMGPQRIAKLSMNYQSERKRGIGSVKKRWSSRNSLKDLGLKGQKKKKIKNGNHQNRKMGVIIMRINEQKYKH